MYPGDIQAKIYVFVSLLLFITGGKFKKLINVITVRQKFPVIQFILVNREAGWVGASHSRQWTVPKRSKEEPPDRKKRGRPQIRFLKVVKWEMQRAGVNNEDDMEADDLLKGEEKEEDCCRSHSG